MQTIHKSLEERQFEKDIATATKDSLTIDLVMVEHLANTQALMVSRLALLGT